MRLIGDWHGSAQSMHVEFRQFWEDSNYIITVNRKRAVEVEARNGT